MQFLIIESEDLDGDIGAPWLVEAKSVKAALKKFAKHTDLDNMLEDYKEDFVNTYDPETNTAGEDWAAVRIFNLTDLQTID